MAAILSLTRATPSVLDRAVGRLQAQGFETATVVEVVVAPGGRPKRGIAARGVGVVAVATALDVCPSRLAYVAFGLSKFYWIKGAN